MARLREMHTSELAEVRSDFALRGRLAVGRETQSHAGGRGLHSSTFQLNLSRF